MRNTLIVAAIIAALVSAVEVSPVGAQEVKQNGNDLIDACRAIANGTAPTADTALRVGICRGEIEALNWLAPGAYDQSLRSCVPTNVMSREMAKVVVDFMDNNRDRLREPFEGLALEALAQTWPCPKKIGWFDKWLP